MTAGSAGAGGGNQQRETSSASGVGGGRRAVEERFGEEVWERILELDEDRRRAAMSAPVDRVEWWADHFNQVLSLPDLELPGEPSKLSAGGPQADPSTTSQGRDHLFARGREEKSPKEQEKPAKSRSPSPGKGQRDSSDAGPPLWASGPGPPPGWHGGGRQGPAGPSTVIPLMVRGASPGEPGAWLGVSRLLERRASLADLPDVWTHADPWDGRGGVGMKRPRSSGHL